MTIFTLPCKRLNLAVLSPSQAALERDFYLRNQAHLAPWSPVREDDYYSTVKIRSRLAQQAMAFDEGYAVHFAVLDRDSGQMIGACNFSGIIRGAFQSCYLGYHIDHAHQGQGLMHEAVDAGIRYMFETLNLHRIMANYIPGNDRSARLLERLGFEREGYAKAYLNINGRWQDHVLTARLSTVWEDPDRQWSRSLD